MAYLQPSTEDVEAFARDLAQIANELDVELTAEGVHDVLERSMRTGFNAAATRRGLLELIAEEEAADAAGEYDDDDEDEYLDEDDYEDAAQPEYVPDVVVDEAVALLSRKLGRRLLAREEAMVRYATANGLAGRLDDALAALHLSEGTKPPDMNTRQGRVEVMEDHFHRLAGDQDEVPAVYDASSHAGRLGYMAAKLAGHDVVYEDELPQPDEDDGWREMLAEFEDA